MENWLLKNKIPFSGDLLKTELYAPIKLHNFKEHIALCYKFNKRKRDKLPVKTPLIFCFKGFGLMMD